MQRLVLDRIDDDRLAVYVVWGPMLGDEKESDAPSATSFLTDARATHYWTGAHGLAEALSKQIGLEQELAWDTFLLYPKGALWHEAPPAPSYVMHVGKRLPQEQRLNGDKLLARVRELLAAGGGPSTGDTGGRH